MDVLPHSWYGLCAYAYHQPASYQGLSAIPGGVSASYWEWLKLCPGRHDTLGDGPYGWMSHAHCQSGSSSWSILALSSSLRSGEYSGVGCGDYQTILPICRLSEEVAVHLFTQNRPSSNKIFTKPKWRIYSVGWDVRSFDSCPPTHISVVGVSSAIWYTLSSWLPPG